MNSTQPGFLSQGQIPSSPFLSQLRWAGEAGRNEEGTALRASSWGYQRTNTRGASAAGRQSRLDSRGERWLADPSLACERYTCPWHPLLFCVQMLDNSTLTGIKGRFWLTVREV